MAKKPAMANIAVTRYEGKADIQYDCVLDGECTYGRFSVEPREDDERCTFNEYGSCTQPHAQAAALEGLTGKIKAELKRLKSQEE